MFLSIVTYSQDTLQSIPANLSIISLDKLKVVYRGIENPISIAVPNAKSYTVSGNGVVLKTDGKYVIKPGSGLETTVYVDIVLEDDSTIREEHVFQIKDLPELTTTINDEFSTQGYLEFTSEELKGAKVNIKLFDFLFKELPIVSSFSIQVNGVIVYENDENVLTKQGYDILMNTKRNDIILITGVRWVFSLVGCSNRPSSQVRIKIIK
jgi:hypothetical protein